MLHSLRLQAVALAFRAMGIFLAVGCAVVFDGRMQVWAQGWGGAGPPGGGLVGPIEDPPAICWILESNFEPSGRDPIWKRPLLPVVPIPDGKLGPDTVGPDVANQLSNGEHSYNGETE